MSEHEGIRIEFDYTSPELKEAMRAAAKLLNTRGISVRRIGYLLMLFSAIVVISYLIVLDAIIILERYETISIVGAFILGVITMCVYWNRLIGAMARDLVSTPMYASRTEMEIAAKGVSLVNQHARSFVNWSAVEEIVELKSGLGLFSGCCIYPIPDRALPSMLSREQVRELIVSWRQAGT